MTAEIDSDDVEVVSCFVICPIGDKDGEDGSAERVIWEESIEVFEEVIQPACRAFGIEAIRADQISESGEIPEQVCQHLRDDDIVIADLTGGNPNVMYELGLRHTTGKATIQIGEKGKLPFDIAAIRTTMFTRTPGRLVQARKQLSEVLSASLQKRFKHVTATRVWMEGVALLPVRTDEAEAVGDEPGYLEKLVDLEENLDKLPEYMNEVSELMSRMNEETTAARMKTEKATKSKAPASARLVIADQLARELTPYAEKLHGIADGLYFAVQKVNPGVRHLLSLPLDGPEGGELKKFRESVTVSLESTESYVAAAAGLREQLSGTGEVTRSLRNVTGRIQRALDRLIGASSELLNWRALL